MMIVKGLLVSLFFSNFSLSQDKKLSGENLPQVERYGEEGEGSLSEAIESKNVIYKYKSEDYFDFDALQVQGELITPGDLATRANKRVRFNIKDHVRKNFDDYIREDLIDIH